MELIKPSAAIHISEPLSLFDRKLFNSLLYNAQLKKGGGIKTATGLTEYHISRDTLFSYLGQPNTKNVEPVREGLDKLLTTKIDWNSDKVDKKILWESCTFLSYHSYGNGALRYVINPKLEEKLFNPTLYAKIQLAIAAKFSQKYTLVLYEIVIDELCRNQVESRTFRVEIEALKAALGYSGEYKHLNNDILKKARKAINAKTEIEVEYVPIKRGRSVVEIEFTVVKKDGFQFPIGITDESFAYDENIKQDIDRVASLVARGVDKKQATQLIQQFAGERIDEKIAMLDMKLKRGDEVKSSGGYLVSAIRDDWKEKSRTDDQTSQIDARHAAAHEQKVREANERARSEEKSKAVRQRFLELDSVEQQRLKELVKTKNESNLLFKRAFDSNGWNDARTQSVLFNDPGVLEVLFPDEDQNWIEANSI